MFGANISQLNSNVNDDNYQDKVFSSIKPSFLIRGKISIPLTTYDTGNYAQIVYTHNYGYIPNVMVFTHTMSDKYINIPSTWGEYYNDPEGLVIVSTEESFNCFADSVAVYIEARVHRLGLYREFNWDTMVWDETPVDEYIIYDYMFELILSMEEVS
ncbi:MAG TPA: hypothetical protein PK863_01985 [Candidatus Dojkabacteria bacterium]|nr:hypothetical protein [Candidatus Dojkabacteria bacterium]HRP37624.1 hypothetical protein [Candidatus Dojkabacteria bacterium]